MVSLIGIGPGIPGLLVIRAADAIRAADVVLRQSDVAPDLLALAREGAQLLEARADAAANAEAMAAAAAAGRAVARLYPGDALTSAAGAAEAHVLVRLGVPFEVIPGIPLELAAATFAGVTPAGGAGLTMVHPGPPASTTTVVLGQSGEMAGALPPGIAPATPAVVVRQPGRSTQRVEATTAAALAQAADLAGGIVLAPAGARLPWFESRPLFGRRIVVTRPRAQAEGFVSWLEGQGAEPVEFPAIRVIPAPDPRPLADAAASVGQFDWLVLTSVNGVQRFWEALAAAGLDSRALGGVRVAAIGPATAAALARQGVVPDIVPRRYVAEAVIEAMATAADLAQARVLLPRAYGAREILPEELRARGATVTEVEAYRAVSDTAAAGELRSRLARGQIDAVTFTSSSTVRNFVDAVGTDLGGAAVACIGPVTSESARAAGLPVNLVATEYTIPGLAAALLAYFAAQTHTSSRGLQAD